MADTYTFKIDRVCDGGEHIHVQMLRNNVEIGIKRVDKTEVLNPDLSIDEVLPFLISKIIKGCTTVKQRKTAIESAVITL